MEMHQIRYFLAVARTLNFTRAADECHVAQPSLTRAIQKLEEELGGLLLHRERQHTHLTELGRLMLPHLERTFAAAQAAKSLARGISKGEMAPLRIGLSDSISSAHLIGLLDGLRSCVNGFELTLVQLAAKELIARALEGDFDLVFVSDALELPDRMRSWTLFRERCRLVVPATDRLAQMRQVTLADLSGAEMIDQLDCPDVERFREFCSTAEANLRFRHRVHGIDQLQRLVLAGFGYGLLPAHTPLLDGLVGLDLAEGEDTRHVAIAVVAGRPFTTATEACLRLARSRDWLGEQMGKAEPVRPAA